MRLARTFDVATSTAASFSRLGRGIQTKPAAVKPERALALYEFEGCPFCRLVREVLTELDLDAMIYPCPKGGQRFRPVAIQLGGKAQFPFLVDANTGTQLYESGDIIRYLFETYGKRPVPAFWRARALNVGTSMIASLSRPQRGVRARPSHSPQEPLALYSIESSPFARVVRETLSELEIAYMLHNLGRTRPTDYIPPAVRRFMPFEIPVSGEKREAFVARAGRMMVPYLIDPNTGKEMFESAQICDYLVETYGG
ncbi:MAG: glutathione S-transferase [Alphaproteobacteria bacterium]|jgi:glutathione S-transferase|nr:glutathione S-transferase [Alphaproteobacteria bacterium]